MQWRTIPPLPDKPVKRKWKLTKVKWLLLLFLIVLLIVLFFRSSISKVQEVHWSGNKLVSLAELNAIGVKPGNPYFGVIESEIAKRIQSKFPFVKSVQVDKHFFSGVINIEVQEYAIVAYELTESGSFLACFENGSVIRTDDEPKRVMDKPVLTQWHGQHKLKADLNQTLAKILTNTPRGLLADISEIRYNPSPAYPNRIKIYTRSGFEVVTTISWLPEKIAYLNSVIESWSPGRITMLEADTYTPYANLPSDRERLEGEQEKREDAENKGKTE